MSTTVSTPKLSEVARHLVIPKGIVTTVFPRVERRMNSAGIYFDRWQQGLGSVALGCRDNGKYAASVGGNTLSIPRQVAKTFFVRCVVTGLCLEFPDTHWLWTSHHGTTTNKTFANFQALVQRKEIRPYLKRDRSNGIRAANGEQQISFGNGSVIQFGAREQGFGRGMDEVDGEVFDEAQILSIDALEDMVPATNQAKHPHGGLLFFMGTPPRPKDPGEAFAEKRQKAIDGKTTDALYVEISAEPGTDPEDESKWSTFNPSFPSRTPRESMMRMLENIPNADSREREMMGIWPKSAADVFSYERWLTLADTTAGLPDRSVLTIAVSPDLKWSCIAMSGEVNGKSLVMVWSLRGTAELPAKVCELRDAWDIAEVGLAGAKARALAPEFVKAGIEFETLTTGDEAAACVAFQEAVKHATMTHCGQPVLDVAVKNAVVRQSGESERWDRRDPKVDDSPLVAASVAVYRWGLRYDPNYEILESIL